MSGEECYRRFLDGDKSGFNEIIHIYHDGLIYFLYGITKNYDDAEDAAADAFVELLVHKHRYSFRSSLKSYLYSTGRHKAIDIIRRRSKQCGEPDEEIPSDLPSPEESVINDDEKRLLRDAMRCISKDYREALHLVYFEDMSIAESAKVMGKSKKQTENCLYRGKQALRVILENKNYVGHTE
ncbi:MAG: RNA polymerase sigma factor [Eubacteriales bacterium]|nr:RNA polymerase sigma factor [Eubacteriales bacterium]